VAALAFHSAEEKESMALMPLDSLPQDIVVAVVEAEEDTLASVASHVEEHMVSTTVAGYSCRVVYGTAAAASTAALEAAVAVDTVVEVAREVDMAQVGAGYGIVALLDCPGSIRQKPSCLLGVFAQSKLQLALLVGMVGM
jgi:hypothetical protein